MGANMFKYDIKKRRIQLGLTLEDVGKAVGVGKSTVRKWETGYIENMKSDKVEKLTRILNITPAEFLGWSENTPSPQPPLSEDERQLLDSYKRLKASNHPAAKILSDIVDRLLESPEQENDEKT